MPLSIKDPETEHPARGLARQTGGSITAATRRALEDCLRRTGSDAGKDALLEDLKTIQRRWNALPVLDARPANEIVGYDEIGIS